MNGTRSPSEQPPPLGPEAPGASLLDAVDRLVDKGAALNGQVLLSIADVDLIFVELKLMVSSVETIERGGRTVFDRPQPAPAALEGASPQLADGPIPALTGGAGEPEAGPEGPALPEPDPPALGREPALLDPERAERGLARLVLTLVEFVRRLLERQAVRRMDGGRLAEADIERLGEALWRLEDKVQELKRIFGLSGEELDLDLGPLGRLNGPALDGGDG